MPETLSIGTNDIRYPHVKEKPDSLPDPQWQRGECPKCGDTLVSNIYHINGAYILKWECWSSTGPEPTCDYARTL